MLGKEYRCIPGIVLMLFAVTIPDAPRLRAQESNAGLSFAGWFMQARSNGAGFKTPNGAAFEAEFRRYLLSFETLTDDVHVGETTCSEFGLPDNCQGDALRSRVRQAGILAGYVALRTGARTQLSLRPEAGFMQYRSTLLDEGTGGIRRGSPRYVVFGVRGQIAETVATEGMIDIIASVTLRSEQILDRVRCGGCEPAFGLMSVNLGVRAGFPQSTFGRGKYY